MRKLLFQQGIFLIFLLVLTLLSSNPALAQAKLLLPETEQVFLGQDHYYSVNFRGNGEAVITVRVNFGNEGQMPLSNFSLRVPRVEAKDINAFQVIREKICSRYQPAELKVEYTPPICLEYEEPDFFQSSYGNDRYQKAKVSLSADTLNVTLPQPIKPGASGSLILFYRAFGYAKKNFFGAYNFTFETAKTESRIRSLVVGVTTDSDIYLRGGKGKVNYRFEEAVASIGKVSDQAVPTTSASQVNSLVAQIGQGEIYKTAKNLLPLDSYLVKGAFADSRLKLYAKEIILGAVIILFLIYLVFQLIRKILSGTKTIVAKKPLSFELILAVGGSFLASFLMMAYTLLLVFGRGFFFSILPYEVISLVNILIILVSIGIYGLLLLLPALISGLRRGIFWGLASFALTIFWLLVGLAITVIIFLATNNRIYPPIPMIRKETEPLSIEGGQSQTSPVE